MLELDYALNLIIKGIEGTLTEEGFKLDYPKGVKAPELPIIKSGKKASIMYRGPKGRIKIEHEGDKLTLYIANADEAEAPDDDMPRVSVSLLDLETFDERDLKYIFEEYIETFQKNFSSKAIHNNKKLPTPVSRTQAKSGALAYDANTLGSRFTTIYPELREQYKENLDTYGEFLAEDFFINYGNALVIETIKENNKIKMRKLFNLLNDIYDDGTNDTQSLVAVTILGTVLADNPELMPNAEKYFGDTMAEPVTEIVKYLRKSKSARMRLKNPPIYKPEKKKKSSLVSSMMGMQ